MVLFRRAAGEIRQIWTIIFGLPKKTFPVDLFPSYLLKLHEKEAGVEREITNIFWRSISTEACTESRTVGAMYSHFTFSTLRNPR